MLARTQIAKKVVEWGGVGTLHQYLVMECGMEAPVMHEEDMVRPSRIKKKSLARSRQDGGKVEPGDSSFTS